MESKGIQIPYGNSKTIGLLDEGVKALGQLIFTTKPYYQVVNERAGLVNLHYVLDGKSQMTIEILATAYSIDDDPEIYSSKESINNFIGSLMTKNLESYLDINNLEGRSDLGIDFVQVFDYNSEIQSFDVSYVACREPEMYPKFSSDPLFSLVFINEEVAIFKVNGEFNQG